MNPAVYTRENPQLDSSPMKVIRFDFEPGTLDCRRITIHNTSTKAASEGGPWEIWSRKSKEKQRNRTR